MSEDSVHDETNPLVSVPHVPHQSQEIEPKRTDPLSFAVRGVTALVQMAIPIGIALATVFDDGELTGVLFLVPIILAVIGANFLIAETGSTVIVTNEGNGDLTQILPKVHIVVTSIEKVLPNLNDLATILRLLARCGHGELFTLAGFALALGVIFALLAVAFGSYLQPLVVMLAIPFGAVGAVLGHILLGMDLSLVSFMGIIALAGVVVNDSLIMVDYANRQRHRLGAAQAVYEAGLRRFRPILLTTLTTFLGVFPMIIERSVQAQFLVPMAVSLGLGVLFATFVIMVLVPALTMLQHDVFGWWAARRERRTASRPEPEVA